MKARRITIAVLAAAAALMLVTAFVFIKTTPQMNPDNLTIVSAPQQEESMVPEALEAEAYVSPVIEGENVALTGTATCSGNTAIYQATRAIDGETAAASYWEGAPHSYPCTLTVELAEARSVHTIRIRLNPDSIWGPRDQTFSVLTSSDGVDYTVTVPSASYHFDPEYGNEVIIELDQPVVAKFFSLEFTENNGANAGQVAEFEIYSAA